MTYQELYAMPRDAAQAYFNEEYALLKARLMLNTIAMRELERGMPLWALGKLERAERYLFSQQKTGKLEGLRA